VTALLDHFLSTDTWVDLTLPESPLYQGGGATGAHRLTVDPPTSVYLPRWQAQTLTQRVDLTPDSPLRATDNPDLPDQNQGTVTFVAAGEPIARLSLAAR
jgi:hypothetical protein